MIEAPAGKNVHLSFLSFEMEDEQDCGYDFIEVFSGFDDSGPSYGRFCGNKVKLAILNQSLHLFTLSAVCLHFRFLQKLYLWMLHCYSGSSQMTQLMQKVFQQLMSSLMKPTTLTTQLLKPQLPFKTIMRENLQHKNPILLLEQILLRILVKL